MPRLILHQTTADDHVVGQVRIVFKRIAVEYRVLVYNVEGLSQMVSDTEFRILLLFALKWDRYFHPSMPVFLPYPCFRTGRYGCWTDGNRSDGNSGKFSWVRFRIQIQSVVHNYSAATYILIKISTQLILPKAFYNRYVLIYFFFQQKNLHLKKLLLKRKFCYYFIYKNKKMSLHVSSTSALGHNQQHIYTTNHIHPAPKKRSLFTKV